MARIRTHSNPFHYYHRLEKIAFPDAPLDLEIGFGLGHFLIDYAKRNPSRHIVGVEIRRKAVDYVRARLESPNVHLVHSNAQICLEDLIEDGSLENVFIFHPDPWFKKSHHKRRVVNAKFLATLTQKLKPGAKVYVSTDVEPLWEAMQEQFLASRFRPFNDDGFWQNDYFTQWKRISDSDGRSSKTATFEFRV